LAARQAATSALAVISLLAAAELAVAAGLNRSHDITSTDTTRGTLSTDRSDDHETATSTTAHCKVTTLAIDP